MKTKDKYLELQSSESNPIRIYNAHVYDKNVVHS